MTKINDLRQRIVEAARRWYRSGGNVEAELAALVQELEAAAAAQGPARGPELAKQIVQLPEMVDREAAIEIARAAAAGAHRPPYYAEPFEPHEWVVDAVRLASARAP